jgi:SET domain-containing protein
MFNHSASDQNVVWTRDLERQVVVYKASCDIREGEELCISYGGNLWFQDADAAVEREESEEEVLGGIMVGLDEEG